MNRSTGGQSSHTRGNDREGKLARAWHHVPTALLRQFTADLIAEHRIRGVAEMARLSKETIRKFAGGFGEPSYATRRALGELFLDLYPGGVMAEPIASEEKRWKVRPRLIELLPEGEPAARAVVALVFRLAGRFPEQLPENLADVEEWVDLQVRGEYWAARHYGEIARVANEREARRERKRGRRRRPARRAADFG